MTPIDWALKPLKRFADFNGRSPRAEYWWYRLGVSIIGFLLGTFDQFVFHSPFYGKLGIVGGSFAVALVIPNVAVLIRRLHDTERSGWWALVEIPVYGLAASGRSAFDVGTVLKMLPLALNIIVALVWIALAITVFVFTITPGTEGRNAYGPDPYGPGPLEEVFA